MKIKPKFFISFILILAVFWMFWLPGIRVAPDFHLTDKSIQVNNLLPFVWKETAVADGLGEYYAPQLWSHMLHIFFGVLALINLPFEIQTKIFAFLILLIGFLTIRKLLSRYELSEIAKGAGTLFFLLNTYFLLLFDGGQLSLALAYSILPLSIYFLINLFEKEGAGDKASLLLRNKVKFAASVLALSIADIRIVYLILPVVLMLAGLKAYSKTGNFLVYLKRLLTGGILAAILLLGLHAYWLIPAFSRGEIKLPQTYERISQVNTLSFSTLGHSLLLQQPHWPQNVFGRIPAPEAEFLIIPLLVFSTLFLIRKNRKIALWLIVALVSVFLSKGFNEPFGQIYSLLFTYIPGFALFRDPAKFYFLTALSYSILIAFAIEVLAKKKFIAIFIIAFLVFLIRPVFLGEMNGLFSEPLFKEDFGQLNKKFSEDKNFSRVIWIPSQAPLGLINNDHPALGADRLSAKRPFAAGRKGTYETFNFLREAPYMGELFDIAGIGYIAYPYLDPRRADMHPDNIKYYDDFLNQLKQRPWLEEVKNSKIPLLKTKNHQDRFFAAANIWWILGSDNILNEATKSASLKLSQNALIFAEEYPGMGQRLDELPEAKIVLNNKTVTDLAAAFIGYQDLIFPAKNLNFDPDSFGFWKREAADLVWWRTFLTEKYSLDNADFDLGGGWAIGEGEKELALQSPLFSQGKILLARVMESSASGSLSFLQDDELIGNIGTKEQGAANIRWFEIGQIKSDKGLLIKSTGDINVVNALAAIEADQWTAFKNKANDLKQRIVNFEGADTASSSPDISYERINPTKYIVKIANLTAPAMLLFSQNYDHNWKANSLTPLPVYSLINGYRIERDGEYIVEYPSQSLVYYGLSISVLTLAALFLMFIRYSKSS